MLAIPRVIPAILAIWSASARVELRGLQPLPLDALLEEEGGAPLDALLEEEVQYPHSHTRTCCGENVYCPSRHCCGTLIVSHFERCTRPPREEDLASDMIDEDLASDMIDEDLASDMIDEDLASDMIDEDLVSDMIAEILKGVFAADLEGVAASPALPSPTSPTDLTDAECVDKPFPTKKWAPYVTNCADAKAYGGCNKTTTRFYCPKTCGVCPGEDALTESDEVFFADSDLASEMIDEDLASDMIDEDLASDMVDEDVASDMIDEVKGVFAADLEARPGCQGKRAEGAACTYGKYQCCLPLWCQRYNPRHSPRGTCGRPGHLGDAYLHEGEGDDYLYEGEGDDVFSMDEMEVPNGEDE